MESLITSDEAVSRAMKNENKSQDRYPFCIVWTKLPCVTWLLPCIGHVGIGDSKGRIWDFAGSYYVGVDDMAFARPRKVWRILKDPSDPEKPGEYSFPNTTETVRKWDDSIKNVSEVFSHRVHNIFVNNCHHHVAECLNEFLNNPKDKYGQVSIAWNLLRKGKFISASDGLKTYLPICFVLIFILVMVIVFSVKSK